MIKVKYFISFIIIVLSFYVTDRILIYIDSKNPIMMTIKEKSNTYNKDYVNAIIKDNTIIPGISGKKVNEHKSFLKMEEFGAFNDLYFIYDRITPEVTLDNNKEKIIIGGNSKKRSVSIILEENKELEGILDNKNIKYNLIVNNDSNLNKNIEYINGELDEKRFSDLESLLNKNKLNKKICLVDYSNINMCQRKKYYLVKGIKFDGKILENINDINSGKILIIDKEMKSDIFNLYLNEIQRLDLNIVTLSELISEND